MSLRWLKPKKRFAKLSDEQLLTTFQETGEEQYFFALFERYTHQIYYNCKQYLSNEEDCKDMVMTIIEKSYEQLPNTQIDYFRSWLFSVIRNHCISHIRNYRRTASKAEAWKRNQEVEEAFFPIYEGNEKEAQLSSAQIQAALQALEENQRRCIYLFYFENKSYREIMTLTGFSAKNVKSYLQNGKRQLKRSLLVYQQNKS